MTLQPRPAVGGADSDRLHVAFDRLLCDDEHPASCRDGAGITQDGRGVDGWSATCTDAASRMWKKVVRVRGLCGENRIRMGEHEAIGEGIEDETQ